jgi:hypothetical protein
MNLKDIIWEGVGRINPCQIKDRLWAVVNTALKFGVPENENFCEQLRNP